MTLEQSAKRLRRAAEQREQPDERTADRGATAERRQSDSEAAAVHGELTAPEHSKGRPQRKNGRRRPSNAGTDGP